MSAQQKSEAWSLGYDWAIGDTYIGDECRDPRITDLQEIPDFLEGVQAALAVIKEKQMIQLLTGELE